MKFATVEKSQRYFTTIDKFIYLTMLRMIDWMMMLIDDVDDWLLMMMLGLPLTETHIRGKQLGSLEATLSKDGSSTLDVHPHQDRNSYIGDG